MREEHVGIATKLEIICDAHFNHSQVSEPEHSSLYGKKQDEKGVQTKIRAGIVSTINWFCQ